jgi:hypothetical protein
MEAIKIFNGSDFRLVVYETGFTLEVDIPDTAQVETFKHWEDGLDDMEKAGFFK